VQPNIRPAAAADAAAMDAAVAVPAAPEAGQAVDDVAAEDEVAGVTAADAAQDVIV